MNASNHPTPEFMNQETKDKLDHFFQLTQAQRDGKQLQRMHNGQWTDLNPILMVQFSPAGAYNNLRIKPDPSQEVARGWNPHKLTVARVGEGWRLVDASEGIKQMHSKAWHEATQFWYGEFGEDWTNLNNETAANWGETDTLRTKLSPEALAALDKPEWKLPEPPEGKEWHRKYWTQDMLPEGYRPLLLGEREQPDDEHKCPECEWTRSGNDHQDKWLLENECLATETWIPHRTRRPLPSSPENWSRPEHVPGPVCWIERSMNGWPCLVTEVQDKGVVIGSGPGFLLTWEHMKDCLWSPTRAKGSFLPCTTPSK